MIHINALEDAEELEHDLHRTSYDLKKAFEVFGHITSIFTTKHNNGLYAFICYGTTESADREYGPRCAAKAV